MPKTWAIIVLLWLDFLSAGPAGASRSWLKRSGPCARGIRAEKDGLACDEYPFSSTLNSGENNYLNNTVSLALLPLKESNRQRDVMKNFYSATKLNGKVGAPFVSVGNVVFPSYYIYQKKVLPIK